MDKNLEYFVCEMEDSAGRVERVYRDDTGTIIVETQHISVITNLPTRRTSTYPGLDWDTAMAALPKLSDVYYRLTGDDTDPEQPMLVLAELVGPRVVQIMAEHADGYTQHFIAHQDVNYIEFYTGC